MTLITAICTAGWVGLAADRRLTANKWQADAETKVAVVDGEYLIGYTGEVPMIEGPPPNGGAPVTERGFERWLHRGLLGLSDGADLHAHLVDYLSHDDFLRTRPIMLVTAGFIGAVGPAEVHVISNSMTDDGDVRRDGVVHPFRDMRVAAVDQPGQFAVVLRGVPVPRQEVDMRVGPMLECHELTDETLLTVYEVLSDIYIDVADQSGGTVGSDVMIATLPREGYGRQGLSYAGAGVGGREALARSVFCTTDGRLTPQFAAASLASGRHPTWPSIMLTRVEMGPDVEWGAHPHVGVTDEGAGDY